MTALLNAVNQLFDLLFRPFESRSPFWSLAVFSLATGLLMVLAYRLTSNQSAIRRTKDRIQAHILEIRLFADQWKVVLRAYALLLRWTVYYVGHSLIPLAVLLVPLVLLLVQLDVRLGRRPFSPGETFLLTARLSSAEVLDEIALRLPEELILSAPPLRIPTHKRIDWRVRAESIGGFTAEVILAGQAFGKQVIVAEGLRAVSPRRPGTNLTDRLLNPIEDPLPRTTALEAIEVRYPYRVIRAGSWRIHWLVVFFVLSLATGFALKGILRTEI